MNAEPDLTMRQVMRLLNVGRQALRNALADKGVRYYRISDTPRGRIRIPASELSKLRTSLY